jgi:hypothetical protein
MAAISVSQSAQKEVRRSPKIHFHPVMDTTQCKEILNSSVELPISSLFTGVTHIVFGNAHTVFPLNELD